MLWWRFWLRSFPSDVTIYTAPTTSETKGGGGLLKVAPEGGQDVKLGDAYILYNDVFYYSQAGTIPEGKVYLTATEEMRTRGSYSLHDNGTTAIDSVYNNKVETPTPWYGLDGHQYTTMPTRKGIYIKDGKKMILRN